MNRKHILFICLIMIVAIVIALVVKQLITPQRLTVDVMTAQVEKSFNSEVLSIIEKPDYYIASFNKDNSIFEVAIDAENGQFSKLIIVQKNSKQPSNSSVEEQTSTVLTKQQAIDIALKEVTGELDSVDFVNTTDGGNYFVEIEQGNNEITVQIHAITGKILSIQYDD